MAVDLTSPQAQIARHYMAAKGINQLPYDVDKLDGQPCWYFYYTLPQGVLELEVYWDDVAQDWDVAVTGFPVAI